MTEEEKKAIDYLQLCYDLSTIDNKSLPKLATVLNLIEKQQKQIENAKEILEDYQNSLYTIEDRKSMSDSHIEMAIYYLGGGINGNIS